MRYIDIIAAVLVIIGGLNWGLVAFTGHNVVTALFGASVWANVSYGLIALAAIWQIFQWTQGKCCRR